MNPWYDRVIGQMPVQQQLPYQQSGMQFQNPLQRANYIMQAMTNPAAFIKQQFPDIPEDIMNDPNKVGNYLQQRFGAPSLQAQQFAQQNMNQYYR